MVCDWEIEEKWRPFTHMSEDETRHDEGFYFRERLKFSSSLKHLLIFYGG